MQELYREYIILSLRLYIAQREENKRTAKKQKINTSINKVTYAREYRRQLHHDGWIANIINLHRNQTTPT